MSRVLSVLSVVFLSLMLMGVQCASTENLIGERLAVDLVVYDALIGPSLSVATATAFENTPEGCEQVNDQVDELFCVAPGKYEFRTAGRTAAIIVDGFRPLTNFVVVE